MSETPEARPDPTPATEPASRRTIFHALLDPSTWTVALLVIFAGALVYAIMKDGSVVGRLADPAYARGAITWIISLATIGIAFVLIYQAFFSTESSDDRFRRAREVFTGLMGVLGTIVGFYFGSTDQPGARPTLSEIRVVDNHLMTVAFGGAPPYRYTVAYDEIKPQPKVSTDGWIDETLTGSPAAGTDIKVTVTDSRNQEITKTATVPASPAKLEEQKTSSVPAPR